ncbi:MAG: Cu2+-exporting ATPase, partial [Rhodococcus sp. (in: high G+C Gram-positive bacteria)]
MNRTTVLEVQGLQWATSKAAVESTLLRRRGVVSAEANVLNQTATVTYDPAATSIPELSQWIRDCGYHCAGRSVPSHSCDPLSEPNDSTSATPSEYHVHSDHADTSTDAPVEHPGESPHGEHTAHEPHAQHSAQDMMGHGGAHAGMSMDDMVRDMRNRFLVALVLSIPIMLWSPMGRDMFGFTVPAPFGLRDDVFTLILSLPVVFYSAWIFFDGAYRALKARTLDMMVLVAVAVGAGWLYSVAVTFTGGGEVFYEAASVLTAFVLLGHWFEMRARGGANDAIRTLLELTPPLAIVLRDGEPVEV